MAEFTQAEKLNIVMKQVFGIQGTSNTDDSLGLKWYEEIYPWLFFVKNEEIFVETVPVAADRTTADSNASTYSFITKHAPGSSPLQLTEVGRTNGRGWAAFINPSDPDAGIYGDWLQPQVFGRGYAMRLYQDDGTGTGPGTEITTTEGAWVPAYKLGLLALGENRTPAEMGWQTPLWAEVFRYTGPKGITGATAGTTLDNAYNSATSEDKIINVDDGPVEYVSNGDYAHISFNEISNPPTQDVQDGNLTNIGGDLFMYDADNSKWLSIDKTKAVFSTRNGDARYLQHGEHSSGTSGFYCAKDMTLVEITAKGGTGNQTKSFSIRKAGSLVDVSTFSLTAGAYSDSSLSLDFNAGDTIQVYCSATGTKILNPVVSLKFAVRES